MADFAADNIPYPVELASEGPGDLPLVLSFIDPIPPSLPSPGRALLFDVTGIGERGLTLVAEYNTGVYEVIHDGAEFSQVYTGASTRVIIPGGFQFLVRRAGGWFGDTVTIRTIASAADA